MSFLVEYTDVSSTIEGHIDKVDMITSPTSECHCRDSEGLLGVLHS